MLGKWGPESRSWRIREKSLVCWYGGQYGTCGRIYLGNQTHLIARVGSWRRPDERCDFFITVASQSLQPSFRWGVWGAVSSAGSLEELDPEQEEMRKHGSCPHLFHVCHLWRIMNTYSSCFLNLNKFLFWPTLSGAMRRFWKHGSHCTYPHINTQKGEIIVCRV